VNRPILKRSNGVLNETGFVQGIGVQGHLHVMLLGYAEGAINGCWCASPVFMKFEAYGAGFDLLAQGVGPGRISLAEKTEINRQAVRRFEHPVNIPWPRRTSRGVGSRCRTRAAADKSCQPGRERFPRELWTYEVHVRVDSPFFAPGSGNEMDPAEISFTLSLSRWNKSLWMSAGIPFLH
jgi:hypothetical protein